MNNALCLITFNPTQKLDYLEFLNSFKNFDIYVIIDDNSVNYNYLMNTYKNIKIIQIDNNLCINYGFFNISYITLRKYVTGWDKAIYYFSINKFNYNNIWFFEDDVYFYSENTILQIDNKYKTEDILCNSSYEEGKLNEWLWKYIYINFSPPYYCGMMCALRLSNNFLNCVCDYVNRNKTLFFLEAFFPTIAKHYKLKIIESPIEFSTITYNNSVPQNNNLNENFLYHPVKDIKLHSIYRNAIDNKDI